MSLEIENDPGWQYLRLNRERMTKEQSMPFDSKKDVWIPDKEEGYVAAQIISTKGDLITVSVAGKEIVVKQDSINPMNPPKFEKTEDMSNLTILNDACVLHNLRARYKEMLIYTYSGLFCIVINPYKRLPIYTDSVATMYMGKRRNEMPPHLFAVSDEAYRNMLQDHENQSMLITGESGAGKTENTKKVISYFASVGASQSQALKANEKKVTLEDQIIQTNPILEAFGNARTVRNNNSSRFGKFIRIHFSKLGKVASCDIEHYLLEKSRVIRQAPGEHYKPELKSLLLLDRPLRDYWFVAQAELTVDGMDDAEEFKLTDEAFDTLHFSEEEKLNCYKLMAAHMHMGIMKFKQRPREEQAEPDGTEAAEKAAKMYGIETEALLKAFTHPRVKVGTEWVNKGQNVDQVSWAVGAMGKAIYARIFHWLVRKCNATLDQKGSNRDYFIGVLDIAGFEIFDLNSFEQLWINFVNEKLQQFFNHHMFVLEQEEYARENIQWTFIDFGLDLQACIELIEKPMGIISMLDEECIVPKATDLTLAQKLNEQHLGKHPNFEKPKPPKGKQAEAHFAMRHYAGIVRYNVMNWLEKNKDPLNDTVAACLKASLGNRLLNEIWADYVTQEEASHVAKSSQKKKGKSGSFMTVSMLYRESLNNLMNMLYKTHPHFIRCIIPNEKKKSGLLDAALVLNQLTCNGVLEGIRICRKGFPNRTIYADYVQRYAILCADESKSSSDPKECTIKMLQRLVDEGFLKEEMFKIGLTKVFFKAGVLAHLEDLRDERLSQILSALQGRIRYFFQQIDLRDRQQKWEAVQLIQRNAHIYYDAITWVWLKLFLNTMPIVRESKLEETFGQLEVSINASEASIAKKRDETNALQKRLELLQAERSELLLEIKNSRSGNLETEEQIEKLAAENIELENVLDLANNKLTEEKQRTAAEIEARKKMEADLENLRGMTQNIELGKRKSEALKITLDNQIKALKEEIQQQDETITRITKETKHQEDLWKRLEDNVRSQEERNSQNDSIREKLRKMLQECEERFEHEKCVRDEAEKAKRKVDGALRIAHETLEEIEKQRRDLENKLRRKEADVRATEIRKEELDVAVVRILKENKENDARIEELEAVIDAERQVRERNERKRFDLQRELDENTTRLEEQSIANGQQVETGKKFDAEIVKLRRELENVKINEETVIAMARKKNSDAISELNDQIAQVRAKIAQSQNDRTNLRQQIDKQNNQLDSVSKERLDSERKVKEEQELLADLQMKCDEQLRTLADLTTQRNRLLNENEQLKQSIHEENEQINAFTKNKAQFVTEIEEAEHLESKQSSELQNVSTNVKNMQRELDRLRELLDDKLEEKAMLSRQISKADLEIQQLKAKLDDNGMVPMETIEDVKRKQESDVEHQLAIITPLERKQKQLETELANWRRKEDDLNKELDSAQQESRNVSLELFKEQSKNDNLSVNSNAAQLTHGMDMMIHRLQSEKVELQQMLDETEAALEAEEIKFARIMTEIKQIKSEAEKRIQEKDEELENVRKNLQRNLEAIQELSIAAEHANKANRDTEKNLKRYAEKVSELQVAIDEEQRLHEESRENFNLAVKSLKAAQSEKEHNVAKMQQNEIREITEELQKSQAEAKAESLNAARTSEQLLQIQTQNQSLERVNKSLEMEIKDLQSKIDDAENVIVRGGHKIVEKLEQRKKTLNMELENEKERYQEALKNVAKQERKLQESEFQIDENKKKFAYMHEMIEKLQSKVKEQKRLIEEKIALEDVEERAQIAENNLQINRTKRQATTVS
ncbi:unnamed protein product [Thelazia callipaeda]|uniref:Myosin motor domain-containing protein n=1 Tax=Thelazia callipaeda TaxID=103827 RepID=A0A0N5CLK6_THECL|nr:unnamed protein product [Thelazia callipaeda]